MVTPLPSAVKWAHRLLAERISQGDTVLDATAGNGHDTLFLAQQVGDSGQVYAFDIQSQALENTRSLLGPLLSRCQLILASHSQIDLHLNVSLSAAVFNLGYLPGADKACITQTDSTLMALSQSYQKLQVGGILTTVVYPGHPGGDAEAQAVAHWFSSHPHSSAEAQHIRPANRQTQSPECWVLIKKAL
jgi:predicted methyltransferase